MSTEFTIHASPGTDVWRKPPTTDVFNAPRHTSPSSTKSHSPLSSLHSARVSFLLPPPSTLAQYDQAGLLLSLTPPAATASASTSTTTTTTPTTVSSPSPPPPPPPKWIKTGVEIYNGIPRAATVACDSWADWSLAAVVSGSKAGGGGSWVTVEVVNEQDELGKSLWVYQVVDGQERIPLREVCWPFGLGDDAWDVTVEAYACRPNKEVKEGLTAQFKDFVIKWI